MKSAILSLNSGSSSLRFALYERDVPLISGKFDRIGSAAATLSFTVNGGTENRVANLPDHAACVPLLLEVLAKHELRAVGHRVVHGGPCYHDPQLVDGSMLTELRRITAFAPNHLSATLALIEAMTLAFPELPQIACFDTAFHHDMPRVAKQLALPRRYFAQGVQRYGFHGLSYAFVMEELERQNDPAATIGRVILAHLGSGSSMAAVRDGRSIDTSMGFTPASGLVMSTRSGDLDPGLFHYLATTEDMTTAEFQHMVNHESGLLGVSAVSSDMRDLLAQETSDERAAEAVDLFCYEAKKRIGSYAAALGGLDTLVFSGGIGENSPVVRERICRGLDFLGIELDQARNRDSVAVITMESSRATVRIIRTDEELMIVHSVCQVLGLDASHGENR